MTRRWRAGASIATTRAALACAIAALAGCGFIPRAAVVPMPTAIDRTTCATSTDTLLVLLPGRGMLTSEFVGEGFIEAVRSRRLAVDVLRADAHIAYYENERIAPRLREDVIAPAQARGYRHIWLVGISLGGLGALVYANDHPSDIEGVVALAPYLGEPATISAIASAGGLRQWTPPAANGDLSLRLWSSLKPYAMQANPPGRPPLYLGYGVEDRLAPGHRVLAADLPAERVATTPGGHDWPEWRRLWNSLLPRLPLPQCD
jgi:pimeloyl-ACP methyl ester carboxylesterase